MKRKILIIMMAGVLAMSMFTACGSKDESKETEVTETVSEDTAESTEEASKTDEADAEKASEEASEGDSSASREDAESSEETPVAEDAAPVEKPETLKFVIVQDTRDKMFKLMNAEGKTLTIDASADQGYTGDLVPKSGEYEIGKSGQYVLPYSSKFTLLDMDDKIVYVSMEYPCVTSVGVQHAAMVTMDENRTVTITGYGTQEFSYRVWLPSKGQTKEVSTELVTGKTTGTVKISYNGTKVIVEQLSATGATDTTPVSEQGTDEDSNVATVDWQTACPWADKIASGKWSDDADLSNVKQLREGIMAAKFTPVTEIEEDGAKVVTLTFYDDGGKKLGVMKFWQKGKHVEFDGKKFDYDDLGLE